MDITASDLQGEMRELAELLGVEQVLELCQLFGGDNLYIPMGEDNFSEDIRELQEVLGREKYRDLQMHYSGTVLYFPTQQTVLRPYIAKQIRQEFDGTNRRRLMRKYNLTKNSFYRLLEGTDEGSRGTKVDADQLTLFDFLL